MAERVVVVNAGGRMMQPPERIMRKVLEDGGRLATEDEVALFRLGREHVPGSGPVPSKQPPVMSLPGDVEPEEVPATVLADDTEAPGDGVTEAELESARPRARKARVAPPADELGQPPQRGKRRRTRRA
jgi:hypothetical protein